MTLQEAIAQRDTILNSLGMSRTQFKDRSVEYSAGADRLKELAYLDELIDELSATPGPATRCTYAIHRRD